MRLKKLYIEHYKNIHGEYSFEGNQGYTLEHLRELAIEFDAIGLAGLFCHCCSLGWHVHCLTEHPIGELGMAKYSVFEIITRPD